MSNNIQRAVAIGADFKLNEFILSEAKAAILRVMSEPGIYIDRPDRELLGNVLEMMEILKNDNSIHRAIGYAEKELK